MNQTSLIKKRQKESLLFKELSTIITLLQQDEKRIIGLVPTRVSLSDDKGHCSLYFTSQDEDSFIKKLEILKLYKPSIRAQLAKTLKVVIHLKLFLNMINSLKNNWNLIKY